MARIELRSVVVTIAYLGLKGPQKDSVSNGDY